MTDKSKPGGVIYCSKDVWDTILCLRPELQVEYDQAGILLTLPIKNGRQIVARIKYTGEKVE